MKLLKRMLIVMTALLALTACTASHDIDLDITMDENFKGTLELSFLINQSDLDEDYTLEMVEASMLPILTLDDHFVNELETTRTKNELTISYSESFSDLKSLETILSRIAGKPVSLEYETEGNDFEMFHMILGFPDDDMFYFDWIYDAIETQQLFGEESGELRDLANVYGTVTWDDETLYLPYVSKYNNTTLTGLEFHTTIHEDFETSHILTLEVKDSKEASDYFDYLKENLLPDFPNHIDLEIDKNVITLVLNKRSWDGYDIFFDVQGIDLDVETSTIEEMINTFETYFNDKSDDFIKSLPKGNHKSMQYIQLWKSEGHFNYTDNAKKVRTISFEGPNVLMVQNSDFESMDIKPVEGIYVMPKDAYNINFVVGPEPSFFASLFSGLSSVDGIILLLSVLLLVMTFAVFWYRKKLKKAQASQNEETTDNNQSISLNNNEDTLVSKAPLTHDDSILELDHASVEKETIDTQNIVSESEVASSSLNMDDASEDDETIETQDVAYESEDALPSLNLDDVNVSLEKPSFIASLKSFSLSIINELKKPQTYLLFALQCVIILLLTFVVQLIILAIVDGAMIDLLGMNLDTGDITMNLSTILAQSQLYLGMGVKMGASFMSLAINTLFLLPFALIFCSSVALSRLIMRLITKKSIANEASYAGSLIIVLFFTIYALIPAKQSMDPSIRPLLLSIFTKAIPTMGVALYLMVGKKSAEVKRTLSKLIFLFIIFLVVCLLALPTLHIDLVQGVGLVFSIINIFLIMLGLYPFGIIRLQTTNLFDSTMMNNSMNLSVIHLLFTPIGLFVLVLIILVTYLIFMDLRPLYKKYGNGRRVQFSCIYAGIVSLILYLGAYIASFNFDLMFATIQIAPPVWAIIGLFVYNGFIAWIVLVAFATERDQKQSIVTRTLNKVLNKIESVVFRN